MQLLVEERISDEQIQVDLAYRQKQFKSEEVLKALGSNEDGDARLYTALHSGRLVYDHSRERWYRWTGHYWEEDRIDQAMAATDAVIDVYACAMERQSILRVKAERGGKKDEAERHKHYEDALSKRIRQLQTVQRKTNILRLARAGNKSLAITGDEWDRKRMLLGCRNGVIDLKSGEFSPGQPDDYLKTVVPTIWRGMEVPCHAWEKFLHEIFAGNKMLIEFNQRLMGYGITGCTNHHKLPILHGQGRNGKGTFLEAIKYVLGDVAYKSESELLLDQKYHKISGAPNTGVYALRGKRIVWCSETSEGRRLNVGRLKELVGGDTLNARPLYGKRHVEFEPSHLLLLLTNSKPHAPANDYALWKRIVFIPFNISFVDEPEAPNEKRADPHLSEKLRGEASGILAWLVRGCLLWQQEGLRPPSIVMSATEEYREEEDAIGEFIRERCVGGNDKKVNAGNLYTSFTEWCDNAGYRKMSLRRFGTEIKNRYPHMKNNQGVIYCGIGLKE